MTPYPVRAVASAVWPYALTAVIGGAAAFYVQGLRLDAVRADLSAARDRIAIVSAENRQCVADVEESRRAVRAVQQAADERERAAKAAQAKAEAQAIQAEKRADELSNREPATADQCAAADEFTARYLMERGQ